MREISVLEYAIFHQSNLKLIHERQDVKQKEQVAEQRKIDELHDKLRGVEPQCKSVEVRIDDVQETLIGIRAESESENNLYLKEKSRLEALER